MCGSLRERARSETLCAALEGTPATRRKPLSASAAPFVLKAPLLPTAQWGPGGSFDHFSFEPSEAVYTAQKKASAAPTGCHWAAMPAGTRFPPVLEAPDYPANVILSPVRS